MRSNLLVCLVCIAQLTSCREGIKVTNFRFDGKSPFDALLNQHRYGPIHCPVCAVSSVGALNSERQGVSLIDKTERDFELEKASNQQFKD